LRHEHQWFVGSKSECSCTFRHFVTTESGFGEPQDWCPEDEDNVRATAELYRVIRCLISEGQQVDCLDAWHGAKRDEIKDMVATIRTVSEKEFLLFENHHLVFE